MIHSLKVDHVPGTVHLICGDCTLHAVAMKAWNKLPRKIWPAETVDHYKAEHKTHLFELMSLV